MISKKYMIIGILSVAVLAFAAAQKITDLDLFGPDIVQILTEDEDDVYSESEEQILMEFVDVAIADEDLFLVYDMSIPMTAKITWLDFEGGIDYTNIGGYVANAHVDWTIDHGASPNINTANVQAFDASLLTSGSVYLDVGGLAQGVEDWSGLIGIEDPPLFPPRSVEVDSKTEFEDMIDDVDDFLLASGDTYTGAHNYSGATVTGVDVPASSLNSGYLPMTAGGLGENVSAYGPPSSYGMVAITGGDATDYVYFGNLGDFVNADIVFENFFTLYSGTHDFTGATLLAPLFLVLKSEDITCASNVCTMSASYNQHVITTEGNAAADVLTVADASAAGTVSTFVLEVDGGDDVEVTPTNFANGTKITLGTVGDSVELEFDGAKWFIGYNSGGVVN